MMEKITIKRQSVREKTLKATGVGLKIGGEYVDLV